MHTDAFLALKLSFLAAALVLLNACGGGADTATAGTGATSSTSSSTATSGSTTTTAATTTTTSLFPPGIPSLTGVAATGAPLLGATVKVLDATGTTVGSGTTSTTDGAYRIVLDALKPVMPLLIQATGIDAAGNPVLLHSLVNTVTVPLLANITPVSNAVVAQVLGTDPAMVFLAPDKHFGSIVLLGNAAIVTSASNLVKTIIKTNLTDGKISNSTTLDFFQDATFTANKTGLDAALEGLRIQIGKDASGREVLLFSNKFNPPGTAEVTLDLATAKSELTKTTGGSVAKAITSTLKATTSPTAILANLAVLDDLSVALNKLIAQGSSSAAFLATPALSATYVSHNGRTRAALASKLAEYAANNYQLSKMQVTGCADNPLVAKVCLKVTVSAVVADSAGRKVEIFSDAVTYDKAATPNWGFVGNAYDVDFAVYPVAFATFGLNGVAATSVLAKPGAGVQVLISLTGADTASRTMQIPSGHSIPFAYCNLSALCVKSSPTENPVASGELKDTLPLQLSSGTIGNLDAAAGARYLASLGGPAAQIPAYLSADVPSDLSKLPFPMLDGIAAKPLAPSDIASTSGLNLSWANWTAANPGLKVFMARTLIASADAYVYSDATILPTPATAVKVPAITIPPGFLPVSHQVWLGAVDPLGRRFYSKFTSTP